MTSRIQIPGQPPGFTLNGVGQALMRLTEWVARSFGLLLDIHRFTVRKRPGRIHYLPDPWCRYSYRGPAAGRTRRTRCRAR